MRRSIGVGLCVALLATLFITAGPASGAAVRDDAIVVLKDRANVAKVVKDHTKRFGVTVRHVYQYALKGYSAQLSASERAAIATDPEVLFVLKGYKAPPSPEQAMTRKAEPDLPTQWLTNSTNRIDAELSSAQSADGQGRVKANVAVLDGGLQASHPDLNVAGGVNCLPGSPSDWDDRDGHGTFVGGIIGARDNEIGTAGVAPGARLYGVRVADPDGFIADSDLLCGIDWVAGTRVDADRSNDITVANMSLGGDWNRARDENCGRQVGDPVHMGICGLSDLGVVSVVAAGNETENIRAKTPASFPQVLTAAAMGDSDGAPGGVSTDPWVCELENIYNSDDHVADFSNWATELEDQAHIVAAPGVCVASTFIGSTYVSGTGTSFATPHVAGLVALCIANGPCAGERPQAIVKRIVSDAERYNRDHPDYGYIGDPADPIRGRYYGPLVNASLY